MKNQVHGDIKMREVKDLFELTNSLKDEFELSFIGKTLQF